MPYAIPAAQSLDEAVRAAAAEGVAVYDARINSFAPLAQQMQEIASQLGRPFSGRRESVVESLSPEHASAAPARSLSARYGKGQFPWHSDAAHRTIPARWIVMACLSPGSKEVMTEVVAWERMALSGRLETACASTQFAFVNGSKSFLSTITQKGRAFIRFDPGCMMALDEHSARALQELSEWDPASSDRQQIHWCSGHIAIIDNWKHLHRRSDASESTGRVLLRTYAL